MQNANSKTQGAKCKMQNGKWKMENAKCKTPNAKCKIRNAKWKNTVCKIQNPTPNIPNIQFSQISQIQNFNYFYQIQIFQIYQFSQIIQIPIFWNSEILNFWILEFGNSVVFFINLNTGMAPWSCKNEQKRILILCILQIINLYPVGTTCQFAWEFLTIWWSQKLNYGNFKKTQNHKQKLNSQIPKPRNSIFQNFKKSEFG